MNKTISQSKEKPPPSGDAHAHKNGHGGFWTNILAPFRKKHDSSLRETLEDYLEDNQDSDEENGMSESISTHEKMLISNILKIHELTVEDIMVPRADIVGVDVDTGQDDLLQLISQKQHSRLPVYKGNLDEAIGCIHIKDVLAKMTRGEPINIKAILRDAPIVSPSKRLLDLLWEMRQSRKHLSLVVDEFGGIDGLVTIEDLVEAIVGEIEDEHDETTHAALSEKPDGTIVASARYLLSDFENAYGSFLNDEERDENDTLGGLVYSIAGRIPARGEILSHEAGIVFEIIDADPRRIHKIRIKNIPEQQDLHGESV